MCNNIASILVLVGISVTIAVASQQGADPRPVETRAVEADPPRLVPGDEIDDLAARIKPPARFADHKPDWRVENRTFTFAHYQRQETCTFPIVLDGEKVVAVLRSGDIMLVARTPANASPTLNMPTERLHLDNLPGPSLPTWQFIKKVDTHGSIYKDLGDKVLPREWWEKGPATLTYVRTQDLPEHKVEARFVFSVDPVFGYRIDAVRDVVIHQKLEGKNATIGGGSFCPGCYVPWDHAAIYDRTAWTPVGGGIEGWANNLLTMDRCDGGPREKFAWRDRGFIAYLPKPDGWSPVFTRLDGTGNTPPLAVCNAHNDFHIKFNLANLPEKNGKWPFRPVHRLMSLPPELTAHVWQNMRLIEANATGLIIKLGKVEDFEAQPVKLTEPARGLVWTSSSPPIVKGEARSGEQAILIRGRQWPNLPQVSLKPNTKYRMEGWYKIKPWTAEQIAAEKAKDEAKRKDLESRGKPLPPAIDWDSATPRAYIRGDYYEWSPYTDKMIEEIRTTQATRAGEWEHVVVEFTSPAWGPFINIAFTPSSARPCSTTSHWLK